MGSILSSRILEDGKIIFEVCMDFDEAVQLRGQIEDIHIFSERTNEIKTNLSQRGKNEATKYFLVPRELRKDLKFNKSVSCQRIDTKTKTMFIYVIDNLKP